MNASNGKEWKWLERDPKSSLKQLSIKGRRIRARTLYGQTMGEDARTPEEVSADYGLPLEAVQEAIEYHSPPRHFEVLKAAEESERDLLRAMIGTLQGRD